MVKFSVYLNRLVFVMETDAPAQDHPHPHADILQKNEVDKRATALIIIGRFYPKSNLTIFYDCIPLYKI